MYLEEVRIDGKENLDVLDYWKANKIRYPELASMARDILSIPITSVASESAFSIGGQIIGKYRSSILPKNTEALLCTRDWLNGSKGKVLLLSMKYVILIFLNSFVIIFYLVDSDDLEEEDFVENFEYLIPRRGASSNVTE